jgi:murein DD-endopeptidase MepM/ murein hydrolase activator NlpD
MRVNPRVLRRVAAVAVAATLVFVGAGPAASYAAGAGPLSSSPSGQACLMGTPPAGSTMPAPFLRLPFRASDAWDSLYDTEGWFTSPDELPIVGETNGDLHRANDLEFVRSHDHGYGLPVLAAADGRAYYSYQYIAGSWTDPATGITHQVGLGGGLFVEVRHAKDQPGNRGWVTQYIHLSRVAAGLPYLAPEAEDDPNDPAHPDWFPAPITQDDDTLWNVGVPVRQGQVIGYMGDTGIGLDWKDNFDVATGKVAPRNRAVLRPWDPTQLHFQLYQGRVNGAKQNIVDPFGLYSQVCPGEWNPHAPRQNPYGKVPGHLKAGHVTAWVTDHSGRPQYAAQ